MKRFLLVLLLLSSGVVIAEELVLSTPVSRGNRTSWQVAQIHINYELPEVVIVMRDPSNADLHSCTEPPTTAQSFIRSFNTADLTDESLQKKMFLQAQAMACVGAGTVTGAPY